MAEVLKELKASPTGLSSDEAQKRLTKYGLNKLVEKEKVSAFKVFLNQFKDIFVIMLLLAIVFSLVSAFVEKPNPTLEDYADAITIGAIVVLNSVVGFAQEYRSEKAMEALKKLTAPKARVLRDGKETIIPAEYIVPGDIIILESGDRVPADGRLIETIDMRTNEAALTGESTPVEKGTEPVRPDASIGDRKCMVFMGTHIIYGRGKAVVTATGMKTEFGKIAGMIQEVEEKTPPLKEKLNRFAKKLSIFIILVCAFIFVLETIRSPQGADLIKFFMVAIALAVSAVPEGLPAIVTIGLALGARELAKHNAIIRRLVAAETLGSTTVICSDKTGTLTKGEMTVRKIYCAGKIYDVTGSGYEPKGHFLLENRRIDPSRNQELSLLLRIGALCNNSHLEHESERWRITGDPTEGALVVAAAKAGLLQEDLERKYPRISEIPFSSERKRMTTIHKSAEGKVYAYVKGAPEIILERCTKILDGEEEHVLTLKEKRMILRVNEEFAENALRVLGIAYKGLKKVKDKYTEDEAESNLVFVGLVGMIDPPREEVKEAIRICRRAGIKPVMITGDHKLTAVAVAKEIGMFENDGLVLTGQELDKLSDEEFEEIVENVKVYARVSPEHKLRIVRALKKKGHVVAMTGDGVNDAPALKEADIGVAMGITGTDVAKEASDMILMDDNFATIVNAVRHGRIIYDNIRKFAFFLMRCNFDELAVIATFAMLGMPLPLTAPMILWINLVTDGGPATALSVDPPVDDVMARPPRDPKQGILHGRLLQIIISFISQYLGTTAVFLLVYKYGYFAWGLSETERLMKAQTMCFLQATLRELVVVWNCRSETKSAFRLSWTSNKFLLVAEILSVASSIMIVYMPVLQIMFGTVPLGIQEWALVGSIASLGFLLMPEYLYGRKVFKWV
ncbi:calcium-translocating P-type ATPase, SERCA-type [Candidatus Bathyarchaeota archaeon]|nr:MAG: calcium-translocating P-type ATPase, SERCA-type [Candidatus Bathyarchaeota archaeon]